ncbi:hypothetical protein, conserved [Plasmodium vivax]|uniref:VIR protein n=1 Tax=Plasmodium vivax TaxID=5855 RepID=A0A1G4HI28_PLAVI|nr:hypothetical protein, conserved [Plasmodium vivax]
MPEINEDDQIPNKFYNRLDNSEGIREFSNVKAYSAIRNIISTEQKRNILDKLARNIKLIISEYSENHEKRCREVNHWINKKIKTIENNALGGDLRNYCYTIFGEIKWNKGGENNIVCRRKLEPYPTEHVDLMKELDDYCEIRDNNRCNELIDDNNCLKCNKYIKKKKQEFTSRMQCICRKADCEWNKYTIDDKCTLKNMDLTFPEISCKGLSKEEELQESVTVIKKYSPLEIGFFILVFFILFYLFILFLEKFTPVGSILNRFRRRKYDLKRNIERVFDDRHSLYHSDTMPADSENKRYYIEYARPHN